MSVLVCGACGHDVHAEVLVPGEPITGPTCKSCPTCLAHVRDHGSEGDQDGDL